MDGKIKIWMIGVMVIMVFNSCYQISQSQCESLNYLFEIDFTISPAENVYSVGDTILVSSNIGSLIVDQKTGEQIDCGEVFLFPLLMSFSHFDSVEVISENDNFEKIESIGIVHTLSNSGGAVELRYQIDPSESTRQLEFFVIPQSSGVFSMHIFYVTTHYFDDFLQNNDGCYEKKATLEFNINDKVSLGYELIESSVNPALPSLEEYEKHGYYSFEVVE